MEWNITENKKILSKRETIRLPNEELQIDLYYNNLSNKQLAAAKQEIESTFYDFKELYDIKQYGTNKTLSIFIHDNKENYYKYGYSYASYCVNNMDRKNTNIANVCHNASGEYNYGDPGDRTLRNQISYALSYYNDISDIILPNKYTTVEIPESNIQVKFGSNSLTYDQIEATREDIIDAFKDIKFDTPIKYELNKYNYLDNIKGDILVSLLKEVYPNKDYDLESAKKAFEDPIVARDIPIFLSTDGVVERSQKLLSNKEIIKDPRYNFEVELNYGNLNEYQIWRAKQEIKNTVYDFKESFGLKPSDVVHKFRILFYDTWDDYSNYTRADHMGHADGTNAYLPLTSGYDVLRHEYMHNIVAYTGVDSDGALPELLNHNIVGHIQRGIYPRRDNELYDGTKFIEQYLQNSEFDVYERVYFTIEFFQEMYPRLINEIYYNRKPFENALDFFKAKFPDMVSHIPDSDRDAYQKYDEKLLNKIFENEDVRQKLLDFIDDKLAEKKYIDKVKDLNAFRVVKGDHIGTDNNTDEEYYQGIIVDGKGEIGSFSPMEYSYAKRGINVFNHATRDSIIIPRKYHNLKLVKVDSDYKLAFCDKYGNEYRNTQSYKNQTQDLLYTDDAQEVFTLVDLHAIRGIIGIEQNQGKIFSIGLANLKFSPISIYDGSKNIGSFTGEIGYVNRGKFYFKDNYSTNFKVYDENRALVTITKEDGEYQTFLRDGNDYITFQIDDVDDDYLSQTGGIELSGNYIDSYSKERETGEISKIEHSLLFRHEPEKEEIVEFDEYSFTVRIHHDLPDDKLQQAIDEVKNNLSEFKTLLDLKENDISSHELYLYNDKSHYQKHTGSQVMYGHFDHSLKTIYFYFSDNKALEQVIVVAQNEKLLPNIKVIEFPDEKLLMNLHYNNLTDKQLMEAEKEIKNAFYDFKNLYGIKEYEDGKILSIFVHDNKNDYDKYAYVKDESMGQYSHENINFANMYYYIYDDPEGSLRHQVSYALTYYNGKWDRSKILSDVESLNDIGNNQLDDENLSGLSYEMINGRLHVTDNETGNIVMMPKRFKYLKLEEDDEGEYKFTLCNKKGYTLFDYRKYAKIDDKYKYIDTSSINYDEEVDFDDYDEEDIFSIQSDKTNPQVIKIFDIYEDEIGMLPNSYSVENNDIFGYETYFD